MKTLAWFLALLALIIAALLWPIGALFVLSAFLVGLGVRFIGRSIKSNVTSSHQRRFLAAITAASVVVVIGVLRVLLTSGSKPSPGGFTILEKVHYNGQVQYLPEEHLLKVRDELVLLDSVGLQKALQWRSRRSSEKRRALKPSEFMETFGWTKGGSRDGNPLFFRERSETLRARLFSRITVNEIPIPFARYDGYLLLRPDDESALVLDVPKYLVSRTFPEESSRQDLLRDGHELIRIPLDRLAEDSATIRLEVLSPLLRNSVSKALATASIATPLKWIFVTLIAVFAEQIKGRVIIPLAKRIMTVLGIRYTKG